MKKYLLFGAGGHAKVVLDIAIRNNIEIEGFLDDDTNLWNNKFCNYSVLGGISLIEEKNLKDFIHVSIGNNSTRKKIISKLKECDHFSLIDPHTSISMNSEIGTGTVIMPGAIINADSKVGDHCIVNTNSSIDHDCQIADFVHVAPGASICGEVQIGEGSLIGVGASIIPGIKVGAWCTIGAGAVVVKDVPDGAKVFGNPAKIVKRDRSV